MIDLGASILVLSPHCDDAVLSVGATLAAHCVQSASTSARVLTVFSGDTSSLEPAGAWDAQAGFSTAGAAARSRRAEDLRALQRLGVFGSWLDHPDSQYARRRDMDAIVEDVLGIMEAGEYDSVLAPGWPLTHIDHAWTAMVAARLARTHVRVVLYAEQPYSSWLGPFPPPPPALASGPWVYEGMAHHAQTKKNALHHYDSQWPMLAAQKGPREFSMPLIEHLASVAQATGEPLAEVIH